MKKVITISAILFLFLTSCSNEATVEATADATTEADTVKCVKDTTAATVEATADVK